MLIGGVAGIVCVYAVLLKSRFRYDDSLDVVGVHGVGGTWGALATGLFASKVVNVHGRNGLFLGDASTLGIQMVAIVATWVFAALVTWILLKILDATMGLRVSTEDEQMGLDLSQHNEAGYTM
jgi:Amt family ammonium transporter